MRSPIAAHLPQSNPAAEQSLLEQLPMVRCLARRIHGHLPRNVEYDDVYSAGVIGLIDASAKFSSAKNVTFASYAQFRVRGAILDSLRKLDWAPRGMRQQGRAAREAVQTLTSRHGYLPPDDEVAAELKRSYWATFMAWRLARFTGFAKMAPATKKWSPSQLLRRRIRSFVVSGEKSPIG